MQIYQLWTIGHGHAEWTWTCSMHHGHGHAVWTVARNYESMYLREKHSSSQLSLSAYGWYDFCQRADDDTFFVCRDTFCLHWTLWNSVFRYFLSAKRFADTFCLPIRFVAHSFCHRYVLSPIRYVADTFWTGTFCPDMFCPYVFRPDKFRTCTSFQDTKYTK